MTALVLGIGALGVASCRAATAPADTEVVLDQDFEGASLGDWTAVGPDAVRFSIREDTNAPTGLFFSFRVENAKGRRVSFTLPEALEVLPAPIWGYTQPVISSDGGQSWTRITDTELTDPPAGSNLGPDFVFHQVLQSDADWIALKIPYNYSTWLALAEEIRDEPEVVSIDVIGASLDNNPLHLVTITDASVPASEKTGIWVLARQHPSESHL